jgi:hypothetical protein
MILATRQFKIDISRDIEWGITIGLLGLPGLLTLSAVFLKRNKLQAFERK